MLVVFGGCRPIVTSAGHIEKERKPQVEISDILKFVYSIIMFPVKYKNYFDPGFYFWGVLHFYKLLKKAISYIRKPTDLYLIFFPDPHRS